MDKYKFSFQIKVTSLLVGSTSLNGNLVCRASCDCPTENCRLLLVANSGLKSTGLNVCEIKLMSPVSETTTTKRTTQTPQPQRLPLPDQVLFTFLIQSNLSVLSISQYKLHYQIKRCRKKQWHIGVHGCYLMFKGTMKLNYNVLVFSHFYALRMFRFA